MLQPHNRILSRPLSHRDLSLSISLVLSPQIYQIASCTLFEWDYLFEMLEKHLGCEGLLSSGFACFTGLWQHESVNVSG